MVAHLKYTCSGCDAFTLCYNVHAEQKTSHRSLEDSVETEINISELPKGEVLAALYNGSKPLGLGIFHFESAPMTATEADALLEKHTYFDYLKGRIMKVDLSGDTLDTRLYDRDLGQGACRRVIEHLKANLDAA